MADKLVYGYDPITKLYTGEQLIQESPLEPGVWLYPPNVTDIEPPIPVAGMDRMFSDGEWTYFLEVPPPEPLPETDEERRSRMIVSRFQALAAMYNAGLLPAAEAYFSNGSTSAVEKLAWNNAGEFCRLSPLVINSGAALGLSDTQLDDLFTAAALISV